jgi:aspartyl-tRNA synthetase
MKLEEELLKYMLEKVNAKYGAEIKEKFDIELIVPKTPFPVMKLKDIYAELEQRYGYKVDDSEKGDLTTEAEQLCFKLSKEKFDCEFLFVTDFDAAKRAFYHMRDENGVPLGFDLLWRGVEITSGAQREHRYGALKKVTEEMGLGEDVKFYLDFFRYGCPPHGGFAIGVDRLTMLLLGLHIKDAMFLFRGPNRLNP